MAGLIDAGFNLWADSELKDAQKSARGAMESALDKLKTVNVGDVLSQSDARDVARVQKQFETQNQYDPGTAALRKEGASNLLAGLDDSNGAQLIKALSDEGSKDSPQRQAIIDGLFSGAKSELDAGATLPPEFQAELVRSGLESTGQAGISPDYRGAAGVEQRTLLGSAGLALKQQRVMNAHSLLSLADTLKQNRAAILAGTLGATEQAKGQQQGRFLNAFTVGNNNVPGMSLGGGDVANLSVGNTNLENQRELMRGGVRANDAQAMGQLSADQVRQGGKMLSSVVSLAMGGMGGGMLDGLMGGGGFGGIGSSGMSAGGLKGGGAAGGWAPTLTSGLYA